MKKRGCRKVSLSDREKGQIGWWGDGKKSPSFPSMLRSGAAAKKKRKREW
jgi:hypothetical protein